MRRAFGLAGVEDVLQAGELVAMFGEGGLGGFLRLKIAGCRGRNFGEPDFGVRLDQIRRLNFHEAMPASRGFGTRETKARPLELLD